MLLNSKIGVFLDEGQIRAIENNEIHPILNELDTLRNSTFNITWQAKKKGKYVFESIIRMKTNPDSIKTIVPNHTYILVQ